MEHPSKHPGRKEAGENSPPDLPSAPEKGDAAELVQVASYWHEYQAQHMASVLREQGISVFVEGDMMGTLFWHYNNATGGIKLMVPREQADRAAALIETPPPHPFQEMSFDEEEDPTEDEEERDREDLQIEGDALARRAWYASLFGMIFFPPLAIVAVYQWFRAWEYPLSLSGKRRLYWAVIPSLIGCAITVIFAFTLLMGVWSLADSLLFPDPIKPGEDQRLLHEDVTIPL